MQLISKFSCKLNIERNGNRLLGPKLANSLFNITMHESNKLFQITISCKNPAVQLPTSQYIPRRFTHLNIMKVGKQCIEQGRISLTLSNYNASVEGYCICSNPAVLTCIYISEAPVEAVKHFWAELQRGPSMKNPVEAQEERENKRKLKLTMVNL